MKNISDRFKTSIKKKENKGSNKDKPKELIGRRFNKTSKINKDSSKTNKEGFKEKEKNNKNRRTKLNTCLSKQKRISKG